MLCLNSKCGINNQNFVNENLICTNDGDQIKKEGVHHHILDGEHIIQTTRFQIIKK